METVFSLTPAIHCCDYLLIIEPPRSVQKQIHAFKEYFRKSYRYPNAIVSKAHITVLKFRQYETFEKQLIRHFKRLATYITPFDIVLHGFGSFVHTLYVDVRTTGDFIDVLSQHRNELRPFLKSEGFPPHFVSKFHMTIARNLTPLQHDIIWPSWNRTKYYDRFLADHMVLLKRRCGTLSYSVVQKFPFQAIRPVTQGRLFA